MRTARGRVEVCEANTARPWLSFRICVLPHAWHPYNVPYLFAGDVRRGFWPSGFPASRHTAFPTCTPPSIWQCSGLRRLLHLSPCPPQYPLTLAGFLCYPIHGGPSEVCSWPVPLSSISAVTHLLYRNKTWQMAKCGAQQTGLRAAGSKLEVDKGVLPRIHQYKRHPCQQRERQSAAKRAQAQHGRAAVYAP